MKIKTLAITALLAAGFALTGQSAKAALTYTPGDLFLGFRALGGTGATQDYLVNIGQFSLYTNGTSFTVGNLGTDLSAVFGASWNTSRGDGNTVLWGVIGTSFNGGANNTKIIYVSTPESGVAPVGKSQSNQTLTISNINTVVSGYLGSSQNATAPGATIQQTSDGSSWNAQFQYVSNLDFNTYAEIEGNFDAGVGSADALLNLYQLNPVNNSAGTLLGSFAIGTNGAVTFTATPVPEPSTMAFVGVAAAMAAIAIRRRKAAVRV